MKPNVIIILNRLVIGGQAVDTIPLAYYLKENFNILILYGEKEADEMEASFLLVQYPQLQVKKITQLRRNVNPIIDFFAFIAIAIQIKKHKATIVHTHGSKSGLLGRLAAFILGVPVIIHTFHGHLFHSYFSSFTTNLIKKIETILASISTSIIALSIEQGKELSINHKIVSQKKLSIIPLGVDNTFLNENRVENRISFRIKYGLTDNDVAIGIIGRLVPIKNLEFFVQIIINILQANHKNIYFFIVGDGDVKQELFKMLDGANIAYNNNNNQPNYCNVIFTSWVEEMASVYHGLDLVALTSFNEGTPLSIIEAQFSGKAVIASNVGGVKDTFENELSGFLMDEFSINEYVEKILLLANNFELRNKMSNHAINFANNKFNKQKEVLAVKNLYLQLLQVNK